MPSSKKEIREGKFHGGGTIQNTNGNRIVQSNVNRGNVNQVRRKGLQIAT